MERNYRKGTYSARYGSDFPHSVPVKGKDMEEQEPKAVAAMPGFLPETRLKFGDCPQTDAGNLLAPVRGLRKREEYREIDLNAFDTMIYDAQSRKRRHQTSLDAGRNEGTFKFQKGGSFNVEIGGGEKKKGSSKHIPSTGCTRAPFYLSDGVSERMSHFVSRDSETCIASSDDGGDGKRSGGNTSTLTSNEDGDSRIMSFSQLPKVVVETSNRFVRYAVPSQGDSFTGTVRQDDSEARHVPSSCHQTSRRRNSRKYAEGEVMSGPGKRTLSSYSARDRELDRVFGVSVWKSQLEGSTDETRKASAVDSGYSDEAGNESSRDSRGREPDVRRSKLTQACDKYGLSYSSREHQSNSAVTDICSSSDSVSLWLEGGSRLTPYHHFNACALTNMISHSKSDDKDTVASSTEKAIHPTSVQEEQHVSSRSLFPSVQEEQHVTSISLFPSAQEEQHVTSRSLFTSVQEEQHVTSRSLFPSVQEEQHVTGISLFPSVPEEQHVTSRSLFTSGISEDTHSAPISSGDPLAPARNMSIRGDDSLSGSGSAGSESNKPEHTFVLSSGRMSKSQEAQLGKRPTTIDDDFDQYFAQLML